MQLALDLASYLLGGTLLLGVVLLALLIKDVLFGGGFKEPHPPYVRMPCAALEQGRLVRDQLQAAHRNADPATRRPMELHLRRLEDRVKHLEEQSLTDQSGYYKAVSRRERQWQQWKALHQQVQRMERADRIRTKRLLEETERAYRAVEREVRDEWQRAVARDKILKDEIAEQGLLDPQFVPKLLAQLKVLPAPEEPAAPAASPANPQVANGGVSSSGVQVAGAERSSVDQSAVEQGSVPAGEASGTQAAAEPGRRRGIGTLSYSRVLEILGGAFKSKRPAPAPSEAAADATVGTSAPAAPSPAGALGRAIQGEMPQGGTPPDQPIPIAPGSPGGKLHQLDFAPPLRVAPGSHYLDPEFHLGAVPKGILRDADLAGTSFAGVAFSGRHRYLDCRFAGADLSRITLHTQQRAHQFVRCDFRSADFSGSRLEYLLFHQCDLSGSKWGGAVLQRVRFTECNLDGVDWSGAQLIETRVGSAPPEFSAPPAGGDLVAQGEPAAAEPHPAPRDPPGVPGDLPAGDAPAPANGQTPLPVAAAPAGSPSKRADAVQPSKP